VRSDPTCNDRLKSFYRGDGVKSEDFEAGHYRDGSSRIHIGSGDPGVNLLYEFDQLIEQAGLPLRINHVDICADAATAAVGVALQPNVEWHIWLLRALHDHMEKPFDRLFSRVAVARMSNETSKTLIAIVETGIAFWTRRFKGTHAAEFKEDHGRALDALRLLVMALSRLTVRMAPDQAADALRRAVEMAKDPLIWHYWLIDALGTLAKYAVEALPAAEQGALALTTLEFPLPSEKNAQIPTYPQIVPEIWNVRPSRDQADVRWDHRVRQLLAAADKGRPGREYAIVSLAYLSMHNVLKPEETAAFGKALWSDVDGQESALPLNTGLSPGAFLQLPAPDGICVQARLRARLFDADLHEAMKLPIPTGTAQLGMKIDHFTSLVFCLRLKERGTTSYRSSAVGWSVRKASTLEARPRRLAVGQNSFATGLYRNCRDPSSNSLSQQSKHAARLGFRQCSMPHGHCLRTISS
jgi:hypothetical protein